MLHAEGYKDDEIARSMGLPVNTVRTFISRARKKLKQADRDAQLTPK
jgi:DNA-directed RNA polymerase specialized sigma24 family protein